MLFGWKFPRIFLEITVRLLTVPTEASIMVLVVGQGVLGNAINAGMVLVVGKRFSGKLFKEKHYEVH